MKEYKKRNLKFLLIFSAVIVLCCAIMIGGAYIYLELSLKVSEADSSENYIPYAAPLPDSAGLLLTLPDNSGYMIYLDFYGKRVLIARLEDTERKAVSEYFGYPVSYTVNADYTLIEELIDRIGGLEITESDGETLRYTGTQISNKLHSSPESSELKKQLMLDYFKKIAELGFSKDDFAYITENSDTDLTVPDCYYWSEYLSDTAKNTRFIN